MKKYKIVLLISLILLCSSFFACSTLPVTQVEKETETIINSNLFDDSHVITPIEKKQMKAVYIADDTALKQYQVIITKTQKIAAANKKWSTIGKWELAGIIIGLLVFIGTGIFKVLKRFHFLC
jgi:hypothetical protein